MKKKKTLVYLGSLTIFQLLWQTSYAKAVGFDSPKDLILPLTSLTNEKFAEISNNLSNYTKLEVIIDKESTENRDLKITYTNWFRFGEALKVNGTLTVLNLQNLNIEDYGVSQIAEAMSEGCPVTYLNLSSNDISNAGMRCLAQALKNERSRCQILNLSYNYIQRFAPLDLAMSLKNNTCLKNINLSHTDMEDDLAEAFGRIFKYNATLEELNLSSNKISTKGIGTLLHGLKENSTLKSLNLKGNPIRLSLMDLYTLEKLLEKRPNLIKIDNIRHRLRRF